MKGLSMSFGLSLWTMLLDGDDGHRTPFFLLECMMGRKWLP